MLLPLRPWSDVSLPGPGMCWCSLDTFEDSRTACSPCPPGTFSSRTGSQVCLPCHACTLCGVHGATTELVHNGCASEMYASMLGSMSCTSCPPDTASSIPGASSVSQCKPCPLAPARRTESVSIATQASSAHCLEVHGANRVHGLCCRTVFEQGCHPLPGDPPGHLRRSRCCRFPLVSQRSLFQRVGSDHTCPVQIMSDGQARQTSCGRRYHSVPQ